MSSSRLRLFRRLRMSRLWCRWLRRTSSSRLRLRLFRRLRMSRL
jgi:hypothetical protein